MNTPHEKDDQVKLLYDGEVIGYILTNRSLTIAEALEILNIDPNEMQDPNTAKYDYGLFELEY